MNKEHLPYLAAILILLPMFSLIVIGAENNNQDNSPEYRNVTVNEAYKMVIKNAFVQARKYSFWMFVLLQNTTTHILKEQN